MKNIRKMRYACMLSLLLSIGTGCSDWLDVRPRNEMKEDDMYANEEGFKSALTGAYIQLAAADLYGKNASMYLPEMLAQHWKISTDKTSLIYNLCNFDYTHEAAESAIESLWKKYYQCIVHLNNLLGNLETSGTILTNGNEALIKGEALGLRGFLHLELLRLFGPVPGADVANSPAIPYQEEMTKDPGKLQTVTYQEVCEKIIRDLDAAEALLSNDPILSCSIRQLNNPTVNWDDEKPQDEWQYYRQVRFNYYAVKGAKARYYHWIGDKENAVKFAKEAIDAQEKDGTSKFTLVTESTYGKNGNLVMKSEHLFGVHNPRHQTIVAPLFKDEDATLSQDAKFINTAYESTMHPDDIRNKPNRYWEEKTYQNSQKTNHFRKYTGSDTYDALNIVPVLRLAEMYLIVIEDSPLSEANEYFKTFRIARNLDISLDNSLATEQDVLNRMEKEYRKEFFGEGQMWAFYKKHNFAKFSWPKNKVIPEGAYVLPIPKSQSVFD